MYFSAQHHEAWKDPWRNASVGFFLLDDDDDDDLLSVPKREENIFSSISGDVVFFGGMQVMTSAIVPLPSRICLVIG